MVLACEKTLTISKWRREIRIKDVYRELEKIINALGIEEITLRLEGYEDVHDHYCVSRMYIKHENEKWILIDYSSGGGWIGRHTSRWEFDSLYDAVNRWHEPEKMILVVLQQIRRKIEEREGE